MKSYNILKILSAVALSLVVMSSCTKNFEELNTNPYGVEDSQVPIGDRFLTPMKCIVHVSYQCAQNLQGETYAGYSCTPTIFESGNYTSYLYFTNSWTAEAWTNKFYNNVMSPISELIPLAEAINYREYVDIAKIIRVMQAHRNADYFGSIIYSEYGSEEATVAYDKPVALYETLIQEISDAADDLIDFVNNDEYSELGRMDDYDYVNDGDFEMWIKFANTLHLRLAMRVVNYDAAWAQEEAEKAVKKDFGVLTYADGEIDCEIELQQSYLYWVHESWGDSRMGATYLSILRGLEDPRLSDIVNPVESATIDIDGNEVTEIIGKYVGMRPGSLINEKANYLNCSNMIVEQMTTDEPMVWMRPSEAYFLQAEMALRGWDVNGAGTAQSLYEAGIYASFIERGTSSAYYDTYINSTTISDDVQHIDYYNDSNSVRFGDDEAKRFIDVPVKWEDSASNVEKLEKIITQHYIATYPDGYEAWAMFRRTGFPNQFIVVPEGNISETNVTYNGSRTVPKDDYVRRLPYPSSEYTSNYDEVIKGGSYLDGGEDTAMAKMFWDVDCINYPENNF